MVIVSLRLIYQQLMMVCEPLYDGVEITLLKIYTFVIQQSLLTKQA